jgi:hypothetical protein
MKRLCATVELKLLRSNPSGFEYHLLTGDLEAARIGG